MTDTITAIQDTYLKKSLEQASSLPNDKKKQISKNQHVFVVDWLKREQGHYLVNLDYDAGQWYIFLEHWDVPWMMLGDNRTIKAVQETFLKKSTEQASSLPDDQKKTISKNQELSVTGWLEDEMGHYLVELDYDAGQWYIYSGHWNVPWEDNQENKDKDNEQQELEEQSPPQIPGQINWQDMNERVSKYFRVSEVTQNDPRRIPTELIIQRNIMRIAKELDRVREQWGSAVGVTSWYRPPQVNAEVGGVPNSQHIQGSAADVYPIKGDLFEFQNWLDNQAWRDRALGYGAPRGFVHLDMRNSPIRWNY